MIHDSQLLKAYDATTKTFDFNPSFEMISSYLKDSDMVIGNIETTFAGPNGALAKGKQYVAGYQGYPFFNAPDALAEALANAGFDLLTTANNHSMDSGNPGLIRTLEVIEKYNMDHTGTGKNEVKPFEFKIKGIRFVLVSYTYGTNSWPTPDGVAKINTLFNYNANKLEEMYSEVERLQNSGKYDFVITGIHFGTEYREYPVDIQKKIVNNLFLRGSDIILGGHPHVPQPFEVRKIERKDGSIKLGFVIYSLGNFISSQYYNKSMPYFCDSSIILRLHFRFDKKRTPYLAAVSFIPIYVQWTSASIRVLPVNKAATETGIKKYELLPRNLSRIQTIQKYMPTHITSLMKTPAYKYGDGYYMELIDGHTDN